jgi:hypothetical protein
MIFFFCKDFTQEYKGSNFPSVIKSNPTPLRLHREKKYEERGIKGEHTDCATVHGRRGGRSQVRRQQKCDELSLFHYSIYHRLVYKDGEMVGWPSLHPAKNAVERLP